MSRHHHQVAIKLRKKHIFADPELPGRQPALTAPLLGLLLLLCTVPTLFG